MLFRLKVSTSHTHSATRQDSGGRVLRAVHRQRRRHARWVSDLSVAGGATSVVRPATLAQAPLACTSSPACNRAQQVSCGTSPSVKALEQFCARRRARPRPCLWHPHAPVLTQLSLRRRNGPRRDDTREKSSNNEQGRVRSPPFVSHLIYSIRRP
jgi:hypothetical protein